MMAKINKQFYIEKIRFSICHKCFNHPCTCEVKITYENPYTIKREQDVKPNTKEEYEQAIKNAVLRGLK